jgi:alginate O-acetyltransferase complex protein AlgI
LGGSRVRPSAQLVNLFVTMLLAGLWHGASWTYVLWGGLHGIFLAINHLVRRFKKPEQLSTTVRKIASFGSWALTFLCVCFAFVAFRAENLQAVQDIWQGMIALNGIVLAVPGFLVKKISFLTDMGLAFGGQARNFIMNITAVACMLIIVFMPDKHALIKKINNNVYGTIFISILFVLSVISMNNDIPFIYFGF